MSVSTWKLVVTPLEEAGSPVEVTVEAENWLAALRRARRDLGDEGGVPSGASCVMSATGEVTILDSANRLRYELARIGDAADSPVSDGEAMPSSAPEAPGPHAPAPGATSPSLAPDFRPSRPHARSAHTAPAAQSAHEQVAASPQPAPAPHGAHSMLVPLQGRDESPSSSSPLSYRERAFLAPPQATPEQLEHALRLELEALMRDLQTAPRGKFVNLAAFDHAFQGRPLRPPVATLQWKDWRGAPVFALAHSSPLPSWQPSAGRVATSFVPPAPAAPAASVPPAAAPAFAPPAFAPPAAPSFATPAAPSFAPPAASVPPAAPAFAPPAAPSFAPPAAPAFAPPAAPAFAPPAPSVPPAAAPSPSVPPAASVPAAAPAFAPPAAPSVPKAAPVPAAPAPVPAAPAAVSPDDLKDPTGDQDRRLAVAFESCQEIYFLTTPLQALDFAANLLGELIPVEAVSGCLYDINTDEFRFVAVTGPGASERRAEAIPSSAGLFAAAMLSGREYLVCNDVAGDARYDAAVDGRVGLDTTSAAYLPLQHKDHLLGMLQLLNRHARAGFSEADMAIASYIAAQISEFLHTQRASSARRKPRRS